MKTGFVCAECGYSSPKWMGRCPSCGAWDTFKEIKTGKTKKERRESPPPISINKIKAQKGDRYRTDIDEFDRVLGDGIVKGSLVLLGGEPGIGKSTLVLQVAKALVEKGIKILYVSGEESPYQIKLRADRMKIDDEKIFILSETEIELIQEQTLEMSPGLLIIDSIQTMYTQDVNSTSGSISQVRECTQRLLKLAKNETISIFITGHVTKVGAIAGPRMLEHMVDTVLYLEGDRNHHFRILRAVKNRFGSTNEIGVFEMVERGLVEIEDPSMLFIREGDENLPGTAVSCLLEGSRAFLVEIQALTSPTYYGYPQRVSSGINQRRLSMLLAITEKKLGIGISNQDVFLNIVGGIKVEEPACDLAVITSISSSLKDFSIPRKMLILGEVGLTGEVRPIPRIKKRITEAKKLGFKVALVPVSKLRKDDSIKLKEVRWIWEAIRYIKDNA